MHVPAEAPSQALHDDAFRGLAHLGDQAALARVVADVGEGGGLRQSDLGGFRERSVAHGRDHHRHGEIDRRRSEAAADRGRELDGGDDVRIGLDGREVVPEREIVQVWQRPRGAVAADPVAADLRLDGDVLLHLVVPVVGPLRADEEGDDAHARLGARVVEVLARVDDLLEPAAERDLVALEEFEDVILLIRLELDLLGVGAEPDDSPADVDRAAVDVLADLLARVAADDEPAAVHHVTGHEVRVARAAERPGLHHLAGAGAEVAVHDDVRAADRNARDRACVAPHDHRALVHVVGEAPAHVSLYLEPRQIGEARAEVARRAVHAHRDRVREPHADVVAGVRVHHVDVLALLPVGEQELVGLGDGDAG